MMIHFPSLKDMKAVSYFCELFVTPEKINVNHQDQMKPKIVNVFVELKIP